MGASHSMPATAGRNVGIWMESTSPSFSMVASIVRPARSASWTRSASLTPMVLAANASMTSESGTRSGVPQATAV